MPSWTKSALLFDTLLSYFYCYTVLNVQVQDRDKGWSNQLQDLKDKSKELPKLLFKHSEIFANDWPIIQCDPDLWFQAVENLSVAVLE